MDEVLRNLLYEALCVPRGISVVFFFLCRWLDSARSLYEQEVATNTHMYLRFKYYSIMDLDMRVSLLRVCVCVHVRMRTRVCVREREKENAGAIEYCLCTPNALSW